MSSQTGETDFIIKPLRTSTPCTTKIILPEKGKKNSSTIVSLLIIHDGFLRNEGFEEDLVPHKKGLAVAMAFTSEF